MRGGFDRERRQPLKKEMSLPAAWYAGGMEFSYRVSEKQYLQAWKLRIKASFRFRTIRTVMF
jgi:hypothetical protein